MSRKLDEKTMTKLKKGGVWEKIMKEVIKDPNLSPEIREGKLKVYYQKGLVMTLDGKKDVPEILAPGYYKGHSTINIDPTHPKDYFKWAKEMVGNYNKNKQEFVIQQRIAKDNSSKDSRYLVVDMEYQFSQGKIPKNERVDISRIDIVAVDQYTKEIILFELKQGIGALDGKSGVADHIRKTNILISNPVFCKELRKDIGQILSQKNELGILNCGNELSSQLSNIKMGIIFISYSKEEQNEFDKMVKGHDDILIISKDFSCKL